MNMEDSIQSGDVIRPATEREVELLAIEKECKHIRNALLVLDLPPKFELVAGQTHRFVKSEKEGISTELSRESYETLHEGIVKVGDMIAVLQKGLREIDLSKREAIQIVTDTGVLLPFAHGTELYINPSVEELVEAVSSTGEDGAISLSDVAKFVQTYKANRVKESATSPISDTRH